MTTYTEAIRTARASLLADLPALTEAAHSASVLRSNHIRGLRVILAARQGGICAGCGRPLAGRTVELAHVIPSRFPDRQGYDITPGGVYAGCKGCNAYDVGRDARGIVSTMKRPDLVQRVHPTRQACLAESASDVDEVAAIRDAIED